MSLSEAAVLADKLLLTDKPTHVFSTSPTTQFHKSVLLALGRNGRVFTVMNLDK